MTRKTGLLLLIAVSPGFCIEPCQAAAPARPPHADVGPADFPEADAVILRHEQAWTLGDDGSIRLVEHKWVKMLSPRAIRAVADPRVGFQQGAEEIRILVARTFTPDGKVIDVPDYGRNLVSPGGVADWPAFSNLRQWVISFSGVQPGAIYELATERIVKPGRQRWLWADLRLEQDFPTIEREVTVTVPTATRLAHRIDNKTGQAVFKDEVAGSQRTYRWSFKDLSACKGEPQSLRWQERCGRLRFTTCESPQAWASALLNAVEAAAAPDERIEAFVTEAIADELDQLAKVRTICDKLKATMNYVGAAAAWAGGRVRPAAEVFNSAYQNAPEAAALCMAALRSADLDASPALAVYSPTWHDQVPVDTSAEAFMVSVATRDGPVWVHPNEGIVDAYGHWSRYTLLSLDADNELRRVVLIDRQDAPISELRVRGRLKIAEDGGVTGRLSVRLTGRFVEIESLRTDKQKQSRVESIAQSILPKLKVADLSVSVLSAGRLEADAEVELADAVKSAGQLRTLALSAGLPSLATIKLPLDAPKAGRRTAVRLAAPFDEDVELVVEFPEGWRAVVVPAVLANRLEKSGDRMRIEQTVDASENRIRIHRRVRLAKGEISAEDFAAVRDAINTLRGEAQRRMAFRPKTD